MHTKIADICFIACYSLACTCPELVSR